MELQPGHPAPDFTATVTGGDYTTGETVSRQSLLGQSYLLVFYPRDSTPGCTIENCSLSDHYADFTRAGVRVFGVSTDSLTKHDKFIANQSLRHPLLSDPDHSMTAAFGFWKPKKFMGKEFLGTERSSVLVDAKGDIVQIWRKVSPGSHIGDVLASLPQSGAE